MKILIYNNNNNTEVYRYIVIVVMQIYEGYFLAIVGIHIFQVRNFIYSVCAGIVAHPSAPGIFAPSPSHITRKNILNFKNLFAPTEGAAYEP